MKYEPVLRNPTEEEKRLFTPEFLKKIFSESRCGVCNHDVPLDHAQMVRREDDGTFTSYHISCEGRASKVKPCEDCGHHRLLCNECKE